MPPTPPSFLTTHLLRAHRAKGIRYTPATQNDCYKTWYAYALRQGVEAAKAGSVNGAGAASAGAEDSKVAGKVKVKVGRDWVPEGGRTYL
jgi:hypothetical protein